MAARRSCSAADTRANMTSSHQPPGRILSNRGLKQAAGVKHGKHLTRPLHPGADHGTRAGDFARDRLPPVVARRSRWPAGRAGDLPAWDQENGAAQSDSRLDRGWRDRRKNPSELASSIVPRGTSSARADLEELLLLLPSSSCGQAAGLTCRVQRKSVPSRHMRCMMTASLRASATIARRWPRRLATSIAQAFNQDHFVTRVSSTCAAS